jgi:hypothetical protein
MTGASSPTINHTGRYETNRDDSSSMDEKPATSSMSELESDDRDQLVQMSYRHVIYADSERGEMAGQEGFGSLANSVGFS